MVNNLHRGFFFYDQIWEDGGKKVATYACCGWDFEVLRRKKEYRRKGYIYRGITLIYR